MTSAPVFADTAPGVPHEQINVLVRRFVAAVLPSTKDRLAEEILSSTGAAEQLVVKLHFDAGTASWPLQANGRAAWNLAVHDVVRHPAVGENWITRALWWGRAGARELAAVRTVLHRHCPCEVSRRPTVYCCLPPSRRSVTGDEVTVGAAYARLMLLVDQLIVTPSTVTPTWPAGLPVLSGLRDRLLGEIRRHRPTRSIHERGFRWMAAAD